MEYWNTPPWTDIQQANDFIASAEFDANDPQEVTLGIFSKDSKELVGKCMLFALHKESRRAEIGFGIGAPHWGKGVVAEAAGALLDYAFNELHLNRIEAEIDPSNIGSGRVLEKLGFTRDGYLPERWIIGGQVSDSALYGLLAKNWRRQQ